MWHFTRISPHFTRASHATSGLLINIQVLCWPLGCTTNIIFSSISLIRDDSVFIPALRVQGSNRHYDEEMLRRIYAALSSFKGAREPYITGRVFLEAYMKRVSC